MAPNYWRPGPPQHMLLVYGYDATSKESIVNDPGTRHGAAYHYKATTIATAARLPDRLP